MKIKLRTKIVGLVIIPALVVMFASTIISVFTIVSEGEKRIDAARNDILERLHIRTEMAVNTIHKFYLEDDSEESKSLAMEMVMQLRYDGSNYFWINDHEPKMVMHPKKTSLIGKSLVDYKDVNGKRLFVESVKVVKQDGKGYIDYVWDNPAIGKPANKISFVMGFEPWNWIIGTGVWESEVEDVLMLERNHIQREIRQTILINIAVGIAITLFFSVIAFFIAETTIVRKIYQLVNGLKTVENKAEFSLRLDEKGNDEITESKKAFNYLITTIENSVQNLNKTLSALAQGDLSCNITESSKGDLEVLRLETNRSIELLTGIVIDVKNAADQVKNGAGELSKSSQQLASGSNEQAASVEQIMSSIEEVERQTSSDSENAANVSQLSQQMLSRVKNGNENMEQLRTAMADINETSQDVVKIIKEIDEIAFQTNLLALNAAVEAARAGKYGKGFAVVAEEVRNLANRSTIAARNTAELIERSIKNVNQGVKRTDETADVLNEIHNNADAVSSLIENIAASTADQAVGIKEINRGINQVKNVVEQNAAISEEAASSAEQLNSLSTDLNNKMGQFIVNQEWVGNYSKWDKQATIEVETDYDEELVETPADSDYWRYKN